MWMPCCRSRWWASCRPSPCWRTPRRPAHWLPIAEASALANKGDANLDAAMAWRILQSLSSSFQSGYAADIVEKTAERVGEELAKAGAGFDPEDASLAWAACVPPLLSRSTPGVPLFDAALKDMLRLGLVWGVVSAQACAAGGRARHAARQWGAQMRPFLHTAVTALRVCGQEGRSLPLTEEASAIDAWAEETGMDAVDALLGLTFESEPGDLSYTAAKTLLRVPELFKRIAAPPSGSQAEAEGEGEGEEGEGRLQLRSVGLHWPMAVALTEAGRPNTFLLAWAVLLSCMQSLPFDSPIRRRLAQCLHSMDGLLPPLLDAVAERLPLKLGGLTRGERREKSRQLSEAAKARSSSPGSMASQAAEARARGEATHDPNPLRTALLALLPEAGGSLDLDKLAVPLYSSLLRLLPASTRAWHGGLRSKPLAQAVEAYTTENESGTIIAAELATVGRVSGKGDGVADFTVKAVLSRRQAVAVLTVEDGETLEMGVRLPPAWPLKPPEVDVIKKVGVPQARLRKWLLTIAAYLRSQNGTLADAMLMWRSNCAREFAGVEECLICYSIVSPVNQELPRQTCRQCSKNFHGTCLYKWFRSAGKSNCPHCQGQW
eukprot:jgi/Botrbrau1/847/Bobra.0352s0041.1